MSAADRARRAAAAGNRVRTLADINNNDNDHAGHALSPSHDDSDDERSSFGRAFDQQSENFFTGGEKSGLAVENPDSDRSRVVRDILRQAELGGQARRPTTPAEQARSRFTGQGFTLGDEPSSSTLSEPSPRTPPVTTDQAPVTRTLTFWREGFNIENGALLRYDDPANQEILRAINSGRAPLHLLDVLPGQPVDVRVERRLDEDYVAPSASKGGFFGSGHRLGS
ncbi:SEP domain-containing protein [Lipomyces japonicus]|uniref:SEP domain-containing protein n=1 Tax=Lipomyces japonicus TaxID=56871 RepID=UPI0034CF94F4